MDKAYMLDDYVLEQDKNATEKENANYYLERLEFRLHGAKTIDEIRREVYIFLDKNKVPLEIEEGLKKICMEFNENTDVYHALLYLENFMKQYLEKKEDKYEKSNDTVQEIKEDLVDSVKRDLDDVGISISGSEDTLIDSIQNEADVYKLKDNVSRTTEYFIDQKELLNVSDKTLVELPVENVKDVLENPTDETLLNDVLTQQEEEITDAKDQQVDIKDDGSVVIQGDATKDESVNFIAMMTDALVTSGEDYGFEQNLDMKFIKDPQHDSTFKVIYADFPVKQDDKMNPLISAKVNELVDNYKSQVSYMDLLEKKSPELMTALTLVNEQVLDKKGAFQMAVKNDNRHIHEMRFAFDENYDDIYTAFHESGAMTTHDPFENGIVRVVDTTPGEQLFVLSTTLDNLREKKKENSESNLAIQNQYQKKLVYPNNGMNEAANVHRTFLIVTLVAEILLVLAGIYFLFR